MKVKLTGNRVRHLRNALGLSVPEFATVLAVHPGTVNRWEGAGSDVVPIDGVAANVLVALDARLRPRDTGGFHAESVGRAIAQALLVAGALVALAVLIDSLTSRKR